MFFSFFSHFSEIISSFESIVGVARDLRFFPANLNSRRIPKINFHFSFFLFITSGPKTRLDYQTLYSKKKLQNNYFECFFLEAFQNHLMCFVWPLYIIRHFLHHFPGSLFLVDLPFGWAECLDVSSPSSAAHNACQKQWFPEAEGQREEEGKK